MLIVKEPESGLETTSKTKETPSITTVQLPDTASSTVAVASANDREISHGDYILSSCVHNPDNSVFGVKLTKPTTPDFIIEAKGCVTKKRAPSILYRVIGIHFNPDDRHFYVAGANLQKFQSSFINIASLGQIMSASASPTLLSTAENDNFIAATKDYMERVNTVSHDLRTQPLHLPAPISKPIAKLSVYVPILILFGFDNYC